MFNGNQQIRFCPNATAIDDTDNMWGIVPIDSVAYYFLTFHNANAWRLIRDLVLITFKMENQHHAQNPATHLENMPFLTSGHAIYQVSPTNPAPSVRTSSLYQNQINWPKNGIRKRKPSIDLFHVACSAVTITCSGEKSITQFIEWSA